MEIVKVHWVMANEDTIHTFRWLYRWDYRKEILLIGQADRQTPSERWTCPSKDPVVDWLAKQGIHTVRPYLGEISTDTRLTAQLFDDIEKLLIFATQPRGNISAKSSCNFKRQELTVRCTGLWPYADKVFSLTQLYCN
jgi:hypothetical protein